MSASISCSDALHALLNGERLPPGLIRTLGEEHPGAFFRIIVEALSDSFDPRQVALYEELMRVWIPDAPRPTPVVPAQVDTVYVLSRVTLGSDIKITSIILDAMKQRFPHAEIIFVGAAKSAELFGMGHREAAYPRSGPVSARLAFAHELRQVLNTPNRIVLDPDSRITQLGLLPVCEPERYFHFPSRTASSAANLTDLTKHWLTATFQQSGEAFIAPSPVPADAAMPYAAISLGVGENETKRIPGDFEALLIRELGTRHPVLWLDRGVGGEEARRVSVAVEASGVGHRVRFWEGSFAGFASIISRSRFYCGYDSAGQHAAAAAGVPLLSFFAGAPSERFAERWAPQGPGRIQVISPRVIMETAWTSESLRSILAVNSI